MLRDTVKIGDVVIAKEFNHKTFAVTQRQITVRLVGYKYCHATDGSRHYWDSIEEIKNA